MVLAIVTEGFDPAARHGFIRDLEARGRELLFQIAPELVRDEWGATEQAQAAQQAIMSMFQGGGR